MLRIARMRAVVGLIAGCLVGLVGPQAQAADQYFIGDGSSLGASVWGASASGPFNAPFGAGNIAYFAAVNGTGTGASITIGGIVALENFTLTSTGGSISNQGDAVVSIDVATGKTLDFDGQAFTQSATAGFIKNGGGVLALAGGAYAGGFTLNQGTVIVRGLNAMGDSALGNAVLTLNGGIVASDASRDLSGRYIGGITIGGNVQFGDVVGLANATANLMFNNAMSLGGVNRVLTLGNGGVVTFGGQISNSGNAGITFAANANGTGHFEITNTNNTYTGTTTITGGEVRFAADGSLGQVPGSVTANSIVIDGGRFATIDGTTFTLNANRGIQLGSAAGTAVSVTGDGTLTYNGIIADKSGSTGTLVKQGAGTLVLGGVSTYTGNTSINQGTLRLAGGNDRLPTGTIVSLGQASSANLGTLDLNGVNQTIAGLSSVTGTNATAANNTVTSASAATLTISVATGQTYTYGAGTNANSGVIAGAITLVKAGAGTQILGDSNTYTGGTQVNGGALLISGAGSTGNGTVTVNNGGTLGGDNTGLIGVVNVASGGTIAPGLGGTNTGILRISDNVTFQSGSAFTIQINGATAGTQHDQLLMTAGNLSLDGVLSVAFSTFSPTGAEQLLIVQNVGSGSLSGTFSNFADGAIVGSYGGFDWKIFYGSSADAHGGSGGNDVVLVPVPEPAHLMLVCGAAVGTVGFVRRRWRSRVETAGAGM